MPIRCLRSELLKYHSPLSGGNQRILDTPPESLLPSRLEHPISVEIYRVPKIAIVPAASNLGHSERESPLKLATPAHRTALQIGKTVVYRQNGLSRPGCSLGLLEAERQRATRQ